MSKAKTKPEEKSGFLTHLIELRDRLLRAVIAIAVVFIPLFPFAADIYDWLAAPLARDMIIIGPVAPFLIPMKLTLMVSFLVVLPYLLFQLWSFVAPGLYKHEKRLVYPLLASSVFLFYLGILFVYFVLLPMMFQIIPQFVPQTADFKPDIAQYLDFVVMMFMAFGIGFEMPIATILLITTGITTADKLRQKRPYVIVGAFVVGMLLTPPDVVSQIMLAIPMWILFEVGIIASKFFTVRVKEASEAKAEMDKADDSKSDTNKFSGTAALQADKLWDDDDLYTYEEDDDSADKNSDNKNSDDSESNSISDEERSILNKDPIDSQSYDDYLNGDDDSATDESDEKDENFFESDHYDELSDDEMEAELDRIEAEEEVEKLIKKKAKKRAKKKAKAKKKKDSKNKKDKE